MHQVFPGLATESFFFNLGLTLKKEGGRGGGVVRVTLITNYIHGYRFYNLYINIVYKVITQNENNITSQIYFNIFQVKPFSH